MYQALYRKYRPQTFDDVVGQIGITQTLKNQLTTGRLSHAYLFTGTRGTGKTSCAKILAKAVNCTNPKNGNPCNQCAACRSIDSGACMDVLEIDAASNNGVDNVRALRDDAIYTPAEVKMRVNIIDEVHMLSMSAFNALLKIIEEPPEHLLFILATTELHKVPATILSRCQRFAFRRILPDDIVDRMRYIAQEEHIRLETNAAAFLARLADGGMRDALSLLDQCASAAADGVVTTDQICRTLGLAGARKTAELMGTIASHDSAQALLIFNEQYAEGKDLAAMLDELCAVARDLLVLKMNGGERMISGICTQQELNALLPKLSAGELLRITSVLRDTAAGFNTSANRRIDAELCILRLCAPESSLDAQSINARLCRIEQRFASGMIQAETVEVPQSSPALQEKQAAAEEMPQNAPALQQRQAATQAVGKQISKEEPLPVGFWAELVQRVRSSLRPPAVGMFALTENAPLRGRLQDNVLLLEAKDDFTLQIVNKPDVLEAAADAASAILGRNISARAQHENKMKTDGTGFEKLLHLGTQYPDILDIK